MPEPSSPNLGYDETLALLQRALVDACANSRAFQTRARGRPDLLSARQWGELAQIEAILIHHLREVLQRELRVEPGGAWADARALYRGLCGGLMPERRLLERLQAGPAAQPVDEWRRGAAQLEDTLWPFFCDRTHHLANSIALALNEPAPYPALVWLPGRQAFRH